jgi:hypothetical protein
MEKTPRKKVSKGFDYSFEEETEVTTSMAVTATAAAQPFMSAATPA